MKEQWFMGNAQAVHCVFSYWDHRGRPLSPTSQSSSSCTLFSSCICPHGNLLPWQPRGMQLAIWWADPCFDRRSIPADTHRHGHMQERTLWQEAQMQTHSDRYTQTCGNTHKWYSSTLPCHVTARPGGRPIVVPCPEAIVLHDWFIFAWALCSLVVGCHSLSLWKCCAFSFLPAWNLQKCSIYPSYKPCTIVSMSFFSPLHIHRTHHAYCKD